MATLNDKNVGDIVKIKENGTAVNFIIVHKGNPTPTMYDDSCNGIWVLRQTPCSKMTWDGAGVYYYNNYEEAEIKEWLNGTYLDTIDEKIRAAIKTVKIPYWKGAGSWGQGVRNGSNGLSCKVFLLSGREVGGTDDTSAYLPADGAKLSYFMDNNSRIARTSAGAVAGWWLRSPSAETEDDVFYVDDSGEISSTGIGSNGSYTGRPAFILPPSLLVDSGGNVSTNTLPVIASDKTGNLGTITNGFTCNFSVNDADASDSLTVTLTLDGVQKSKFTAIRGVQYIYALSGKDWLGVTNGSHTFKIAVFDGRDTVESTATFIRNAAEVFVTLDTPLASDDVIRACSLKVEGSFPADAVCKYEVTNNALDDDPVWEDCTERSKAGLAYMFKNRTAENGYAINFRVSVKRGASNAGGYITKVSGGFE